jgi:hypothetical protein
LIKSLAASEFRGSERLDQVGEGRQSTPRAGSAGGRINIASNCHQAGATGGGARPEEVRVGIGREPTICPTREHRRRPVLAISRGRYFELGGFSWTDGELTVRARSGRVTTVERHRIAAVVSSEVAVGSNIDYRVLIVDAARRVLAQDTSLFYDDDALARLSRGLGVPLQTERFRSPKELDDAHPGIFRYRWERYPFLTGILITPAVILAVVAVIALIAGAADLLAH